VLKEQDNFYTGDHISRLTAYANQAAVAISRAQMVERLSWFATTDPLTGVPNRRYFYEIGARELERAQRYLRPFSVLMLDIDHFKSVNDRFGHSAGDRLLSSVVELCLSQLRKSDHMGRLGGEEFAFVLPETNAQAASAFADRLRACISRREFPGVDGPQQVTVSIGVAQLEPDVHSLELLISRADNALYQAKIQGRNRVEVYRQ
jgi:diguanylate cyclase (GGDEF)-like protein